MPRNKRFDWAKSNEKKQLIRDLRSGHMHLEVAPRVAFENRPEFLNLGYKNWYGQLRSAKEYITDKNNRATSDSAAYAHDRNIYPKAATTYRGEPRWQGSIAEASLKQDITEGNHNLMIPQELYNSRRE
eukprot:scaffold78230_cov61-Attheya_sp.AAC.4